MASRKFLMQLVARGIAPGSVPERQVGPGCKVDSMLVLVGPEYLGKSAVARALMPCVDWFTDHLPNLKDKDSMQQLAGHWLIEMAELDAMDHAPHSKTNAFLTTMVDTFRAPYGRRPQRYPRTTCFLGTTNTTEFLTQHEGNRRFWPVVMTQAANTDGICAVRDQLFAEAKEAVMSGEQWHPNEAEHLIAQGVQREHVEQDPWQSVIQQWITKPHYGFEKALEGNIPSLESNSTFVVILEILVHALGKQLSDITKKDSDRVGKILRSLGWTRGRQMHGGARTSGFVPPKEELRKAA
jgi:putative DNA primase/helicase